MSEAKMANSVDKHRYRKPQRWQEEFEELLGNHVALNESELQTSTELLGDIRRVIQEARTHCSSSQHWLGPDVLANRQSNAPGRTGQ